MGPLGSFIQFLAGRRWNCGRRGSDASLDWWISSARTRLARGRVAKREADAAAQLRKWRRDENMKLPDRNQLTVRRQVIATQRLHPVAEEEPPANMLSIDRDCEPRTQACGNGGPHGHGNDGGRRS